MTRPIKSSNLESFIDREFIQCSDRIRDSSSRAPRSRSRRAAGICRSRRRTRCRRSKSLGTCRSGRRCPSLRRPCPMRRHEWRPCCSGSCCADRRTPCRFCCGACPPSARERVAPSSARLAWCGSPAVVFLLGHQSPINIHYRRTTQLERTTFTYQVLKNHARIHHLEAECVDAKST